MYGSELTLTAVLPWAYCLPAFVDFAPHATLVAKSKSLRKYYIYNYIYIDQTMLTCFDFHTNR